MLGQQFYENPQFKDYFDKHFVMFRAVLQEPAGRAVFYTFKINGTPTLMLLDGTGAKVDWMVGYRPPAENVQKSLDKMLAGEGTFQSLSAAYAKNPKDVATVFLLARKYNILSDAKNSDEKYKEVIALDPDGKAGTFTHEDYKVTAPYTEFAELAIARTALDRSRKPDVAPMRAFLDKHPRTALMKMAYEFMGYYYGYLAPKGEAAAFYAEYAGKFPADPMVLFSWLTRIVRDGGPADQAVELAGKLETMTEFEPSPSINQLLAEAYSLKGDKAKIEELYGRAFMESRVSSWAYSLAGYARYWLEQNANLDSAVAMIDKALKLEPENTYIVQQAAAVYVKTGREGQALALYGPDFAKKSWDDGMALWQYAGFWARQEKNLDGALAAAKRSVELIPGLNYLWNTLSLVYEKQQNYPEAIKAAEKALETAPESAKVTQKKTIERLKAAAQDKK
ncbi:MAG TPA: tetratricopeptide repeat protein [Acidobacteriota bacterium]|nr:tetratricopeptide repeat protein [Acidobacteriota bacterium]